MLNVLIPILYFYRPRMTKIRRKRRMMMAQLRNVMGLLLVHLLLLKINQKNLLLKDLLMIQKSLQAKMKM